MRRVFFALILIAVLIQPLVTKASSYNATADCRGYNHYDGYMRSGEYAVYAEAHDDTSDTATGWVYTSYARVGQYYSAPNYEIYRGALYLDTTLIPETATITSAKLYLKPFAGYGGTDTDLDLYVCSNNDLSAPFDEPGDYQNMENAAISDAFEVYDGTNYWDVGSYEEFVINDPNDYVVKGGVTVLVIRTSYDIDESSAENEVLYYYTQESGTNYEPYLELIYSVPSIGEADSYFISNVAVFDNYTGSGAGDQLWAMVLYVHYSDYPDGPMENPSEFYDVRLTDESDVITYAQSPLLEWGYRPFFIYLSAANAVQSDGSVPVVIRLTLSEDKAESYPLPETTYTLTEYDWKGVNLGLLDSWIELVARSIGDYDGDSFELYLDAPFDSYKLNEEGSAIFNAACDTLAIYRPHMFLYGKSGFPIEDNWDSTYQDTLAGGFGTKMNAAFTNFGSAFGVSGDIVAVFVLILLFGAVAGIVYSIVGKFDISFAVSALILIGGGQMGVIPLAALATVILILVFYVSLKLFTD